MKPVLLPQVALFLILAGASFLAHALPATSAAAGADRSLTRVPLPPGSSAAHEREPLRAQYRPECFYVHGIEDGTGRLYRIDLSNGLGNRRGADLIAQPPPELDLEAPDALAFDRLHDRLYFAGAGADGRSRLYFYDLEADAFFESGPLRGRAHGAAFVEGAYHYVDQGTDELRRVFLNEDGSVFAEATVADFALDQGMRVDDLAVLDGVLYGSTSGGEETTARFFVYEMDRDRFRTLSTGSATYLQLAFANDRGLRTLYGVSTHDGVFYEIDHADWAEGSTIKLEVDGAIPFSDLARGPACG